MSDSSPGRFAEAGQYEIRILGRLDDRWVAWFDGMDLTVENDGTTLIRGEVADQAALHGLLHRVRDTGLPLVSVVHSDATNASPPSPERLEARSPIHARRSP
jgi:hypothetical protein